MESERPMTPDELDEVLSTITKRLNQQDAQIQELKELRFTKPQLEIITPMLHRIDVLETSKDRIVDTCVELRQDIFNQHDEHKEKFKEFRDMDFQLVDKTVDLASNQKDILTITKNICSFLIGYFADKIHDTSLEYFKSLLDALDCINA